MQVISQLQMSQYPVGKWSLSSSHSILSLQSLPVPGSPHCLWSMWQEEVKNTTCYSILVTYMKGGNGLLRIWGMGYWVVNNACNVYLVVVLEPFSVSQSWGGRLARNLHNKRYKNCTYSAISFSVVIVRIGLQN